MMADDIFVVIAERDKLRKERDRLLALRASCTKSIKRIRDEIKKLDAEIVELAVRK